MKTDRDKRFKPKKKNCFNTDRVQSKKVGKNQLIDPILNEELFNLWASGYSLIEIYNLFLTTEKSFSYDTLIRSKTRYKWDERREEIVDFLSKKSQQAIEISQSKQLKALELVIHMNLDRIKRDYNK